MSKTIDEIREILLEAVKQKAADTDGIFAVRGEADGEAVYYVDEEGNLKTGGYAEADSLDVLTLYELAYIIEEGETPDAEEIEERGLADEC